MEEGKSIDSPVVFISYCWTSDDFTASVVKLATELMDDGVDVLLDKWSVEPGEDLGKYMEKMVADESVTKVIIISNRMYVEKSNKRHGGVGAEAQIISSEIYSQQDENKFVLAAFEWDQDKGKPYIPAYYGSRKYIDFTSPSRYSEAYEELLRCILGRPLYRKPKVGKIPSYLLEEDTPGIHSTSKYRQVILELSNASSKAMNTLRDYLEAFIEGLESFRIVFDNKIDYSAHVFESIQLFLPYKNEWLNVLNTCARYCGELDFSKHYQHFFESFFKYTLRRNDAVYMYDREEENYKFFLKDLFISYIAILVKYELFPYARKAWKTAYYLPDSRYDDDQLFTYVRFDFQLYSIYDWNDRRNPKLYSPVGFKLLESLPNNYLNKEEYIQAECLCFLYSLLNNVGYEYYKYWYPQTLLYSIISVQRPFEIFVRSQSNEYLKGVLQMFNISSIHVLKETIKELQDNRDSLPRWQYYYPNFNKLLNLDKLGSME